MDGLPGIHHPVVLHFAWIATAVERVLVLALLALAGAFALAHRR
ncbi:hypothetical protein WKS99_05060 [Flintibacter sp. HCN-6482]